MVMKKVVAIAALLLLLGISAPRMNARPANAGSAGVPPPPSSSQIVLAQWNEIGRKLIAMAEDFPEDKYEFKPTQPQRSFAEQLLHVSGSMYYFTDVAQGQ